MDKSNYFDKLDFFLDLEFLNTKFFKKFSNNDNFFFWLKRKDINYTNFNVYSFIPLKLLF